MLKRCVGYLYGGVATLNWSADASAAAVQVFNNSLTSSDLQWDGELLSVEADSEAPRIVEVEPPPGTLERLIQVMATFTEPVAGISAADLCLSSRAATVMSGIVQGLAIAGL